MFLLCCSEGKPFSAELMDMKPEFKPSERLEGKTMTLLEM
jgi:hypothetical protein